MLSLCADVVARNAHGLTPQHLEALGEQLSSLLLLRIVALGRLDFHIARTFLDSRFEGIVEALQGLDLLAGLSAVAPTACRPTGGSGAGTGPPR